MFRTVKNQRICSTLSSLVVVPRLNFYITREKAKPREKQITGKAREGGPLRARTKILEGFLFARTGSGWPVAVATLLSSLQDPVRPTTTRSKGIRANLASWTFFVQQPLQQQISKKQDEILAASYFRRSLGTRKSGTDMDRTALLFWVYYGRGCSLFTTFFVCY